jgi:hypothetical protein
VGVEYTHTERRGWTRGGAVGAGPGDVGNVRNWKLNNFEGGGVSIRSEWKESLNAVVLARNTYLLDKNKNIDKQRMTRPGIEPGFGLPGNAYRRNTVQKAGRTIRYESVLRFCFCSSESGVGL